MKFLLSIVLFSCTFALYLPTRNYDFVDCDDISYVKDNEFVNKGLLRPVFAGRLLPLITAIGTR